jgi:hypothetical protein
MIAGDARTHGAVVTRSSRHSDWDRLGIEEFRTTMFGTEIPTMCILVTPNRRTWIDSHTTDGINDRADWILVFEDRENRHREWSSSFVHDEFFRDLLHWCRAFQFWNQLI